MVFGILLKHEEETFSNSVILHRSKETRTDPIKAIHPLNVIKEHVYLCLSNNGKFDHLGNNKRTVDNE